jgi:hypothetical protein
VTHQDWFSLFLKPENATDAVVLTLEAAMLLKAGDNVTNEGEQVVQRLKDNVLTYEYQNPPRTVKAKLVNLHVSRCYSCKGFALWVRDRLVFPLRATEARYTVIEGVKGPGEEVNASAGEQADEAANEAQEGVADVQQSTEKEAAGDDIAEDFEEAAAILNKSPGAAAALMRLCIQNMMPLLTEQGKNLDENMFALVRKGLEVEIQESMDMLQVLRKNPFQASYFEKKEDEEVATKFVKVLKGIMERRMLQIETTG